MKRFRLVCLWCVSLWVMLSPTRLPAQVFPSNDGEQLKYTASIEMQRAYLSGICVLQHDGNEIKGSLFNEFGITALDFTYDLQKEKIRLHSLISMMDKWYIRKTLRKDLRLLMRNMQNGLTEYTNQRRHIKYQLTPLKDEQHETTE